MPSRTFNVRWSTNLLADPVPVVAYVQGVPPFRAQLGLDALLAGVEVVLRAVSPDAPEGVSQSAFDRERGEVTGMPSARVVCSRLSLPWAKVREVALLAPDARSRGYGVQTKRAQAPVSEQAIRRALRHAAEHAGRNTLRPHEYEQIRDEIEHSARRAWRHGPAIGPLPTVNQITEQLSWDEGLAVAGLAPLPVAGAGAGADPAVIADAFIDAFGCLPQRAQLETWARQSDIPLAQFAVGWRDMAKQIAERRAADGLPPLVACPCELVTDPALGAPRAPGPRSRPRERWTVEDAIAGVAIALDELGPGERLTQRRLTAMAKSRAEIPHPSRITRLGLTLEQVRARAETVRLAGRCSD